MRQLLSIACLAFGSALLPAAEVDFARDIRPLLNAKCTECHGGVKAAGGVSFVYEDRVIGFVGDSGNPAVKAGDAAASEMFYRITTEDEGDQMPPPKDHAPLTPEEVALIRQWIEEGARWSGHWAFETPTKPAPPGDASVGTIDAFLQHRLEQEGLKPAEREEPGRLLRRTSLALTGLPPTLAELKRFEAEWKRHPRKAMESAVDELLARPAFGERWASMWLDLVRYADSGGLGQDQKRTIWAFRDWVVEAFNDDMPFDQFTVKQLAGDLLPEPTLSDLVATASQRNTQTNNEGGTDDEQFRVEAVVDRVNTTWQTWGSITFGCVQCHDHPYDPLRHEEYYQFMDFFNNSADSDLSKDEPLVAVPTDGAKREIAAQLRAKILRLKQELWEEGIGLRDDSAWEGVKGLRVASNKSSKYVVEEKDTHDEFHTVGTVETGTHTWIDVEAESLAGAPVQALKLTVLPLDPDTALKDSEWGFVVSNLVASIAGEGEPRPVRFRASVADVPWMPTQPMQLLGANGKHWGADSRIHHARTLVLVPEQPLALKPGETLELRIHCDKNGHGSHPMAIERGYVELSRDARWNRFENKGSERASKREQLAKAAKELSAIPSTTVPVMLERPEALARPTHVFARGNPMDKDVRVHGTVPVSLSSVASIQADPNRLSMARWWVSEDHPLTARVFVNRLWDQLFGIGIVPTLEDFGSAGEKPTHPQLLDYLAVRFQRDLKWSMKGILREMVLSHAFQQDSTVTAELLERDPDNRLLARGPRLRLTAEMIRDQALAVSGLLSVKVGGPPVHPPIPEGVWRPFQGGDKWETPKVGEEDRYRRSLYTYTKRTIPYPTFASFDAPSREFCNPRRLSSNTPLQALVTLNDEAFVECASTLGKTMSTLASEGGERRAMAEAYQAVTGRRADGDGLKRLQSLLRQARAENAGQAWTVVGQVLLNLDETLTY